MVVLERVNIRYLPAASIPEPIDLATLDLSFISLTLVLPKILELLRPGGEIVALVKPQFEVGKGQVGKGGVVRDPQLQEAAVQKVAAAALAAEAVRSDAAAAELAEDAVPLVRPFANLAELPEDLADAFEAFKLAILRHKAEGWRQVSLDDVTGALNSLKELAWAPSVD